MATKKKPTDWPPEHRPEEDEFRTVLRAIMQDMHAAPADRMRAGAAYVELSRPAAAVEYVVQQDPGAEKRRRWRTVCEIVEGKD